jgi:hypothetical protein
MTEIRSSAGLVFNQVIPVAKPVGDPESMA